MTRDHAMSYEDLSYEDLSCEDLSTYFVDFVNGDLPPAEAETVRTHLAGCAACRNEVDSLGSVWQALGEISDEEPSEALRQRFYAMLDAYEAGMRSSRSWSERFSEWLAGWWPRRPTMQLAVTAAALVAGLAVGGLRETGSGGDLEMLRDEVESLNRRVSLVLLADDSASSRLQGVSYTRRAGADVEIITALVGVMNDDENPSVRLAAVDALGRFAERPEVAGELRESLARQSSPLVQVALADLLLEIGDGETRRAVTELLRRDDLDETVRGHLRQRLGSEV